MHLDVEHLAQEESSCSPKKHSKKPKKVRKWLPKQLQSSSAVFKCTNDNEEPTIIKTFKEKELKLIDVLKLCFADDIINYICRESAKFAAQKGESQFAVSVEEL